MSFTGTMTVKDVARSHSVCPSRAAQDATEAAINAYRAARALGADDDAAKRAYDGAYADFARSAS